MKYIFKILTIFLLFQSYKVYSCINSYDEDHTKLNGSYKHITNDEDASIFYRFDYGFDIEELQREKTRLFKSLSKRRDYKVLSDYASVLLKLREYKRGLEILEDLIVQHPNEYNIIVNLGTAYELNNKPELALKYIRRAVKINPQSHHSSEWIHVKILEAKIALKKDKNYLKYNSTLNLNIPNDIESYYKTLNAGDKKKLNATKEALAWQLGERISFVAPPDPIVSDLLYDLANLVALTQSIESSLPAYKQSLEYLPANVQKVLSRRDMLMENLYWTNFKRSSQYILVIMAIIGFFYFIIRRRRKRRLARKLNSNIPKVNQQEAALVNQSLDR